MSDPFSDLQTSTDVSFLITPMSSDLSSTLPRKTSLGIGPLHAKPHSKLSNPSSCQSQSSTSQTSLPPLPLQLTPPSMPPVQSSSRPTLMAIGIPAPTFPSHSPQWNETTTSMTRTSPPALKSWRHYLHRFPFPVQVFTDHKNLTYFRSPQTLNC